MHLQLSDDGCSIFVGEGFAAQVTSQGLALGHGLKDSILDTSSMLSEAHVSQHHDGAKE